MLCGESLLIRWRLSAALVVESIQVRENSNWIHKGRQRKFVSSKLITDLDPFLPKHCSWQDLWKQHNLVYCLDWSESSICKEGAHTLTWTFAVIQVWRSMTVSGDWSTQYFWRLKHIVFIGDRSRCPCNGSHPLYRKVIAHWNHLVSVEISQPKS